MILRHLFTLVFVTIYFIFSSDASPDNSSLVWGPYRPNLYFGVRPRISKTLLTGLMWSRMENNETVEHDLRHTCEQNEGMNGYGWTAYDPRQGGLQNIHDAGNKLDFSTEFFKAPDGPHGGNWGVRVRGVPRSDAQLGLITNVIFYVGMEEMESSSSSNLECAKSEGQAVECQGAAHSLGDFKFHIQDPEDGKPSQMTSLTALLVPEEKIWQGKSVFTDYVKSNSDFDHVSTHDPQKGNMVFVQKVFQDSFEFDILFSSQSASQPITSTDLDKGVNIALDSFSSRFKTVYPPKWPYDQGSYANCSRALLSNLLGGLNFGHGKMKVDNSHAPEYEEKDLDFWKKVARAQERATPEMVGPFELFSLIPSRLFFPRGFLWDDGFHLLFWFALIDDDGWIAREQILGDEPRSKVPSAFQTQYPHHANPPALFLVVAAFLDRLGGKVPYNGAPSYYLSHPDAAKELFNGLYPLLKRQYSWSRNTQAGDLTSYSRPDFMSKEGYRWQGRTPQYTLASGLDNYPRANPPHPGELHIGALTWVSSMAGSLHQVSAYLDQKDDQEKHVQQARAIKHNFETALNDMHTLVCRKGYISLFPFLLGLLEPDHHHLNAVLTLINDEGGLWSKHGIRSLSKKDQFYGKDENYWRSPVWIPINYLIVERLLDLAQSHGPFQQRARDMYSTLRRNLVDTVYTSWRNTGFAWEQYNPDTGAGQRTQDFTGWTALAVKIMAFPNLETSRRSEPLINYSRSTLASQWAAWHEKFSA
ncbi:glycoside hydrolase family 63 protein [Aplosporella prunicola CBS 121167]|uniref:Mannosyl-oligosaccharide glucosidase n=1 Tax=Aplosporella prunicola CBS 121167 TaxID=1176127 RepID=A0A6A6B5K3_9PEZI|nr:glycoside hydrolase family 63 protein [Aplosporella prunicola CBS 121167]KAF2138908.1 glycoside hydrolase family 63 protein [Aplosporella prunicola CBS 121167]